MAIFCSLVLIFVHGTLLEFSPRPESEGHLTPNSTQRTKRLPQVIIVGARKSGTRALLRFIQLNPAVKSAASEVHFFDRQQNFRRGLAWYRDQMPATTAAELTIEKSPAYFVGRQVPERVRAMNSSIKLVLILREPVTRLISDFSQLVANRLEQSDDYDYYPTGEANDDDEEEQPERNKTLQVWQEAEKEFEQFVLRPDGGIDDQRPAVRVGMYSSHLERWLALFARGQFHFVDGERLIARPHEELRKLEAFLGLEPVIGEQHFVFNPKKGFYCLAASSRGEPGGGGGGGGDGRPSCLSKSKGRRHVRVKRQLVQQLQEFYAPYNDYLYSLTGINFNNNKH